MNLRGKKKFMAEVSTSSMSDIMFFLMLFFLIASTMVNPSVIKLTLPRSQQNQAVRKAEISISITKDLKFYINNKEIPFDNLESECAAAVKSLAEPTIVIRCDNSIPVQELVNVLQIGNKLKIKMILATKSPNG
jgi:biopolymer transport protein ExbD